MKNVFTPADILLPKDGKFSTWSVIACDQFSSEREYWDRVGEKVKDCPSTLHMVVPEAYLGKITMEEAAISRNDTMKEYLEKNIPLNPLKCESLIPSTVGELVKAGTCKVKVLSSKDRWFGVTYKEDKPDVVARIQEMKDAGVYPDVLWK